MKNTTLVPASPLARSVKFSIMAHVALLMILFIQEKIVVPVQKLYIPSIRVDLVALPDQKVNEVVKLSPENETQASTAKALKSDGDVSISKKSGASSDRLKKALSRIKALERVRAMTEVKGNEISKGSSITGEVKKELMTTYFDVVLEKVRENWELPKWLLDQNLSAQALIKIDAQGNIKNLSITKSSGNAQFDQEVRRAVQLSSPLPLPPADLDLKEFSSGIILGFPL